MSVRAPKDRQTSDSERATAIEGRESVQEREEARGYKVERIEVVLMRTGMHRRAVGNSAKFAMGRKFNVPRWIIDWPGVIPLLGHASVDRSASAIALQSVTGEADLSPSTRRAVTDRWHKRSDGEACHRQSSLAWCTKRRGRRSLIARPTFAEVKRGWR